MLAPRAASRSPFCRLRSATLASLLTALVSAQARGQFDLFQWSFTQQGNASYSLSPQEMVIIGADGGCPGQQGDVSALIAIAPVAGTIVVRMNYETRDKFANFDPAVIITDGVTTEYAGGFPPDELVVLEVQTGSSFGFGISSVDCGFGAATLVVNDLQFFPDADGPSVSGTGLGEELGRSLASVGDVDGDGIPDILVGAPGGSVGSISPGRALLVSGATGVTIATLDGETHGERFGSAVSAAGDVNGDGVPDVLVGAPLWDSAVPFATDTGYARVFSGTDSAVLITVHGTKAFDELGTSVAALGDIDSDGSADIAYGAPFHDAEASNAGMVQVISGASGQALLTLFGSAAGDRFGLAVAGVGLIDPDAVPDLLVGAPYADTIGLNSGHASVHSGSDGTVLGVFTGGLFDTLFGTVVAAAGDVDADGHGDIIVCDPGESVIGSHGTCRVYSGATLELSLEFTGNEVSDTLGSAAAGIGDLDGDGHSDVAVGLPFEGDDPLKSPGLVHVYSGRTGSLLHVLQGDQAEERFGSAVIGAGDLDSDGTPEVLVGAPEFDGVAPDSGRYQTFRPSVTWTDVGHALAGSAGLPSLAGQGFLVAPLPVTLTLTAAPQTAHVALVMGLDEIESKFKGGVLVPAPDVIMTGFETDAAGSLQLLGTWPPGVPAGTELTFQFWLVDPAGPAGLSASNGLRAKVP